MTTKENAGEGIDLGRRFERLITERRLMRLREPGTEAERLALALNSPPEEHETPEHEKRA